MGFLDFFRTKTAAASPVAAATGVKKAPYTGTPGVVVHQGEGQHGHYEIDPGVVAQGSAAVLRFVFTDEMLEEVMHNGSDRPLVVFHRSHGMCDVNHALDPATVIRFITDVAKSNKRPLDDANPFLDGSLDDGSRINVSIPPVSGVYPNFTVRKFKATTITVPDLVRFGALSPDSAAFLWCAIEGLSHHAANVLVVGGTGSGKTTLLNALSWFAPMHHRIVVIEDTRELRIPQPNVLRMGTTQTVHMDHLLINALRQRPDRIIVGEVRGPEARTLFTAMNTGHDGCMGTLHANSARESMMRISSPPMQVPIPQLAALDLVVVQQRKTVDGAARRFCAEITEVSGFSGDTARLNQIYTWDEFKRQLGNTGVPSRLRTKICQAAGISADVFTKIHTRRMGLLSELATTTSSEKDVLEAINIEHARGKT
jgi:flagellar protein FlaI